jgi:hypothetical protein
VVSVDNLLQVEPGLEIGTVVHPVSSRGLVDGTVRPDQRVPIGGLGDPVLLLEPLVLEVVIALSDVVVPEVLLPESLDVEQFHVEVELGRPQVLEERVHVPVRDRGDELPGESCNEGDAGRDMHHCKHPLVFLVRVLARLGPEVIPDFVVPGHEPMISLVSKISGSLSECFELSRCMSEEERPYGVRIERIHCIQDYRHGAATSPIGLRDEHAMNA